MNLQSHRYFWVDALRGIAALCIVVFHYHHFYLEDAFGRDAIPPITEFPYASVVWPLYSSFAANAVEMFWLISGFVFAHVYLHRPTSAWQFSVARFARLYPLHFATLLYVAILQLVSLNLVGHWQIYANNDTKHFILQLFMSSNWNTWSANSINNSASFCLLGYFLPLFGRSPFPEGRSIQVCWILLPGITGLFAPTRSQQP